MAFLDAASVRRDKNRKEKKLEDRFEEGDPVFDDSVWLAGKLSARALGSRFQAVAENLANVNTPGYRRKEVDFEENLREALEGVEARTGRLEPTATDENHIGRRQDADTVEFDIEEHTVEGDLVRLDGNNVDMEIEMAKMAETRMAYTAVTRVMAKRAELIRTAMGG